MSRPVDPEGLAARFIDLQEHETTHDRLVWGMRHNRDQAVAGVPEWAKLRELASQIKEHTLTHLDQYLEQFEQNATKRGTHVHWARDAEEHNTVVYDILHAHGVKSLIKSKSMLQEECGMTPYLQKRGIEVTESDLGERIQQLSDEAPSHIVVPAIHKLRSDVAALFAKDIGTDPKDSDPHHLAEAMRQAARPRFMAADAGMTGANFAVAETGGFVVCTNEGDADMGASLPPLYIASIGIEKLVPRAKVAELFPTSKVICSAVPEVPGTKPVEAISDPHDLNDVDVGVVRSRIGVAEAGAVWLTEADLVVNALGVLSQHLVVLLDPAAIVETMHDAYGQIDLTASSYGVFMAGPSATGDIEGVIIHGAQGARSMTILLLAP
jgi:L-lactate utilization protein LutB